MNELGKAAEIERLAALRDQDLLSAKEFEVQRRRILRSGASQRRSAPVVMGMVAATVGLIVALGLVLVPSSSHNSAEFELAQATSQENAAVAWAVHQEGSTAWVDQCLKFVYTAYLKAGVNLWNETSGVNYNANTDPQDVWGHFTKGVWQATTNTSSVPYGALVFFNAKPGYDPEDYSHVTIMGSNGVMISTPDLVGRTVHSETFAQRAHAYNTFVGWWLPDATKSAPTQAAPSSPASPSSAPSHGALPTVTGSLPNPAGANQLQPASGGSQLQPAAGSGVLNSSGGQVTVGGSSSTSGSSGNASSPKTSSNNSPASSTSSNNPPPSSTSSNNPPASSTSSNNPPANNPPSPPATHTETTGPGPTHTWTNYQTAGGNEGPSIPDNDTVQVTCRAQGWKAPDGNTWWYEIASSPWDNAYWASADAFYNNGETSGSLVGTPFVDNAVPNC